MPGRETHTPGLGRVYCRSDAAPCDLDTLMACAPLLAANLRVDGGGGLRGGGARASAAAKGFKEAGHAFRVSALRRARTHARRAASPTRRRSPWLALCSWCPPPSAAAQPSGAVNLQGSCQLDERPGRPTSRRREDAMRGPPL